MNTNTPKPGNLLLCSEMSLFVSSLNSGSNANCYYVGNAREAVLVDAGLSCRETEKRLARLGLTIKNIKAIFISHEHSDHIRGLEVLSRKHQIPVYITEPTRRSGNLFLQEHLLRSFVAHEEIKIGELSILPFPKQHDAADPFSFVIKNQEVTVGVMTDIGSDCEHVVRYFKMCHAVFLETNYDSTMLETGPYPVYLKRRIAGDKGHLSNDQALALFMQHRAPFLSHVFLSHLSKENNDPLKASSIFEPHRGSTDIIVASRYKETPVFCIQPNSAARPVAEILPHGIQTALF